MPTVIRSPSTIRAAGNKPKTVEEYIGRVNSNTTNVSIARMKSPSGWIEPGQRPDFDEYTLVLKGMLSVETEGGPLHIHAGEAVVVQRGEWVRYSTPGPEGAEYLSICVPAFSMETVHREE